MLIKRAPNRYDKLRILGGMAAADDILTAGKAAGDQQAGHTLAAKFAAGSIGRGPNRVAYSDPRKNPAPGIYKASLPNGKKINLMRVMFTDFCKMDCAYCPTASMSPASATPSSATSWPILSLNCTAAWPWTACFSAPASPATVPKPPSGWWKRWKSSAKSMASRATST